MSAIVTAVVSTSNIISAAVTTVTVISNVVSVCISAIVTTVTGFSAVVFPDSALLSLLSRYTFRRSTRTRDYRHPGLTFILGRMTGK